MTNVPVSNAKPFKQRCDAYRERHGDLALGVYLDVASSELYVVKSSNAEDVTLISVQAKSERVCRKSDLLKSFCFALWVWDEMVYYIGDEAQQAAQQKLQASVAETIETCLMEMDTRGSR
ncbi:MAG: hypothetical protein WC617_12370 [Rhodanobacter sp.]|jgi:hypothetical protein